MYLPKYFLCTFTLLSLTKAAPVQEQAGNVTASTYYIYLFKSGCPADKAPPTGSNFISGVEGEELGCMSGETANYHNLRAYGIEEAKMRIVLHQDPACAAEDSVVGEVTEDTQCEVVPSTQVISAIQVFKV